MLALQVLLTRLFAAVLFYHFGFLAISLALVGTGAGGLIVYVRPRWFERVPVGVTLARLAAAFALLLVVVPLALVRVDYSFGGHVTWSFAGRLGLACLLAAIPFTAGGLTIALAIRAYTRAVPRVYGADLLGAGVGAIAVVPAMWIADPATLMVVLGAVAGVAAVLFAGSVRRERWVATATVALAAALAAVSAATSLYFLPTWTHRPVFAERWTPLARVIGDPPDRGSQFALLYYDRVYAPVPVHRAGTPYPTAAALHLLPQSIGYAMSAPGRALVIGGGGGRDIYNALDAGQRRVDVIELNDGIVKMVDRDLARWSGSPYALPRVHTVVGDGRSVLARRNVRYDQIHIGFTDTLSANSATAFALTENNLYTVEAFDEYLDHLTPRGVLNVSRLYKLVGDEGLRVTVLTLSALERRGIAHPERNVVVILGHDILGELFGTTLARKVPWTPREVARIRALARADGLQVAYAPGGPYRLEWAELARARSLTASCSSYRLDVCPPTDNKPFFFNMRRLGDIGGAQPAGYIYSVDPVLVLLVTLAILLVLAAIAFGLPLAAVRKAARPTAGSLLYFVAIGVGYLVLEIVLIQRLVLFLGFPTYALSVVLFALLISTGVGSLASGRLGRRSLAIGMAAAAAGIVVLAFALEPLLHALIALPFAARVAIAVAVIAPFGVVLGTAMPVGLRRLEGLHPGGALWAWAINGVASVVASVLAVAVAIEAGFSVATLVAAACYAAALAHVLLGRWPTSEPAVSPLAYEPSPERQSRVTP